MSVTVAQQGLSALVWMQPVDLRQSITLNFSLKKKWKENDSFYKRTSLHVVHLLLVFVVHQNYNCLSATLWFSVLSCSTAAEIPVNLFKIVVILLLQWGEKEMSACCSSLWLKLKAQTCWKGSFHAPLWCSAGRRFKTPTAKRSNVMRKCCSSYVEAGQNLLSTFI